jgi:hypothetical protein
MTSRFLSEFISSSANYGGFFDCQIIACDEGFERFIGINTSDNIASQTFTQELYTLNSGDALYSKDTISGPQGDGNFTSGAPYLLTANGNLSKVLLALTTTPSNISQGTSYLYLLTLSPTSSISALTIDDSPSASGAILSMALDLTGTNMYIILNGDLYYLSGTNFLKKITGPTFNIGSFLRNVICSADGQTIYCNYIGGSNDHILYKFTGGVLTVPSDLSTSFSQYASSNITVNSFACDSTGTILYLSNSSSNGFLYKYDGSWSRLKTFITGSVNITSIKCDPSGRSIIIRDTANQYLHYSDDGGNTWQFEDTNPGIIPIASPSNFRQYNVRTNNSSYRGLYERRSKNLLPSSSLLTALSSPLTKIITSGDGSKVLAINGSTTVYFSNTYGNTFMELTCNTAITNIAASDDFSVIVGVNTPITGQDDLNLLTISGKTLLFTPVEYVSGSIPPASKIFRYICVSRDGNTIAAVYSAGTPTVYRIVYSVKNFYTNMGFRSTVFTDMTSTTVSIAISSPELITNTTRIYVSSAEKVYRFTFVPTMSFTDDTVSLTITSIKSIACSSSGEYIVLSTNEGIYYANNFGITAMNYQKIIDTYNIHDVSTTAIFDTNQIICDSTGVYLMFNATGDSTSRVYFIDSVDSARFASQNQTMKITSNPNPQLIAMSSNAVYQYTFDTLTGFYSRNATAATPPLANLLKTSLSTLYTSINLTSIVSDENGNVRGVNYADTDTILYSSPAFTPQTKGSGRSAYLISASPDLGTIFVVTGSVGQVPVISNISSTPSVDIGVDPSLSVGSKVTSMVVVSASNLYFTLSDPNSSSNSGLYSFNSTSNSFERVADTGGALAVACNSTGTIVYYITGSTVNTSTNSATSFTNITYNLSSTTLVGIACDSSGSILYACDPSKIYKYNSNTNTWSILTSSVTPSPNGLASVVCDPTGTHIMANDIISNFVLISDDGGATWQKDVSPTGAPPLSISSSNQYSQYINYSDGFNSAYNGIYERKSGAIIPASSSLVQRNPPLKVLTNGDGSKILIIDQGESYIKYSSNYGNNFLTLTPATGTSTFIEIAASSDFSVIVVQLSDNSLNRVTLLANTYTLTALTYDTGVSAPSDAVFLAVSLDGKNIVAVTSLSEGNYDLYYAMNSSTTFQLKSESLTGSETVSAIACSNMPGAAANIYVSTSGGKVDTHNYTVGSPLAYRVSGFGVRNNFSSAIMSIVCDSTGSFVYIAVTAISGYGSSATPIASVSAIYSSSTSGIANSFTLLTTVTTPTGSLDAIKTLVIDSTGQNLIVLGYNGLYFYDNISTTAPVTLTQPVRRMVNTTISRITSNSNGAHQYFFDSRNGLFTRNATAAATPCFLEGTKILCNVNAKLIYLPVETLTPGTLVKTAHGHKKIKKIGKSGIKNPGSSSRIMDRLYVCRKEVFPELIEDLYITGYHSILVPDLTQDELDKTMKINGCVFEADNKKCLMAAVCDKIEPWAQEGVFTIWHFSLEDEDKETKFGIYSNGLLTETCSMSYMDKTNEITFIKSG